MSAGRADALVIGASGQDGSYLLEAAARAGLNAVGTSRNGGALERLDPLDRAATAALCDAVRPARIILLAGQSSVGGSFRDPAATIDSHVAPLLNVLEWMRRSGTATRLVYAASGECFGPRPADRPVREDNPFAPVNPYGVAKAMAATLLRGYRDAYGLHASNAFLFNHESPRRPAQFVFGKLLAGIARLQREPAGPPIALGSLDVVRDWGWAPDYAEAMLRMADRDAPGDLVLATGHSVSLRAAVEALLAAAGLDRDAVTSAPAEHGHGGVDAQHADPSHARVSIGWSGSTPFPALAARLLADVAA